MFQKKPALRRSVLRVVESLERRMLMTSSPTPEPNDSFAQAYVPPNNFYLDKSMVATGTVSASDTEDYYKFYSLYGKSNLYAAVYNLSSDADLYVYDQNQNLLGSSTKGGTAEDLVQVDIPANQYFYVRVHKYSTGSTNYTLLLLNDYAGSTLATAHDLGTSWGQSTSKYMAYNQISFSDYLDYRDNVDISKFYMEAPGTISLRRLPISSGGGLDTTMQLLDANGNVLADGASSNGALNVDRYAVPQGTYYVKFTQTTGAGDYQFRVTSDYAGETTATARNWGDLTGTSREANDMVGDPFLPTYSDPTDLYKFTVSQTTTVDAALIIPSTFAPRPSAPTWRSRATATATVSSPAMSTFPPVPLQGTRSSASRSPPARTMPS